MTPHQVIESQAALIDILRDDHRRLSMEKRRRPLVRLYAERRCFICGLPGWCGHREPAVDLAEVNR